MTTKTPMIDDPEEQHKTKLRALLHAFKLGEVDVNHVLGELTDLPFADLGYATVDHHRVLRHGVPEVIYGSGKTAEQVVGIARELIRKGQNVLATRIDAVQANAILQQIEAARVPVEELARLFAQEGLPFTASPVVRQAWTMARAAARSEDLICVTGSVFLAGELRPVLLQDNRVLRLRGGKGLSDRRGFSTERRRYD